jgi:hypothetical protein
MVITKKYLVVPINPYVTVKRIFLTCDEKLIFDFDARLDFVNPTCYQYVNVERYIGRDIFITSQPEIELNFSFSDEKSLFGVALAYSVSNSHFLCFATVPIYEFL